MMILRLTSRWLYVVLLLLVCGMSIASEPTITLQEAFQRVDQNNLELKALRSAVKAADGAVRQARLIPNPEAEIELEDLGRSTTEVVVSQTIGLGGTRGARIRLARAAAQAAEIELTLAGLRLRAEAMRRFGATIAVKQKLTFMDSLIVLAENTMVSVERRVEAGAAMTLDLVRAETALQEIRLERAGLEREFLQARRELAMLWNEVSEPNWEPAGMLTCSPFYLSPDEINAALESHPAIRLLETRSMAAREERAEARAGRFPELSIGVGVLLDNEQDQRASLLRASVSMPLFDRQQGTFSQKGHELQQAECLRNNEITARRTEVTRVATELTTLTERIATTQRTILPKTEQILTELMDYYRQGAVGILEVLEAQRAVLEKWLEHTDNLRERTALAADLLKLTGIECEVLE
jgi:cobalt-zinc-cadmium efflux system outer membrane protein